MDKLISRTYIKAMTYFPQPGENAVKLSSDAEILRRAKTDHDALPLADS